MNTNNLPATKPQAAAALTTMRGFIGTAQLHAIDLACQGEERQFFYDKLCELADLIEHMPITYATDGQGGAAVVQLHYFTQGANWYLTERDQEAEQLQAFGLADLFGDGGELGYISIVELLENGAELDLYWTPKPLNEIE